MNIDKNKLDQLLKTYWLEYIVEILEKNTKSFEYDPLMNEKSYDIKSIFTSKLNLFKDNKKFYLEFDHFDLDLIKDELDKSISFLDFVDSDKDIQVLDIRWEWSKDFRNDDLSKIDYEYIEKQFDTFKNYDFSTWVSIESFSYSLVETKKYFLNSFWSYKSYFDNYTLLSIDLFAKNSLRSDHNYKYFCSKNPIVLDENKIKKLETDLLDKINYKALDLKTWTYDIVLENHLVESFFEIIISSLSAEIIREWLSLFSNNKLWDEILSDKITLKNIAFKNDWLWNKLFDSEWKDLSDSLLIENWVLKTKIYDYKNASKEGVKGDYTSSICNIVLENSDNKDSLLDWNSFLFTNLMAFHSVDTISWKYALSGNAYIIENWKKTDFVKDISLTGNLIDLFNNVKSIWKDKLDNSNLEFPSMSFSSQKVIFDS